MNRILKGGGIFAEKSWYFWYCKCGYCKMTHHLSGWLQLVECGSGQNYPRVTTDTARGPHAQHSMYCVCSRMRVVLR